ncbi:Venom carboxylesterase-6 [Amphibalanus amphitrite]|uniref:Carboxylic ester hydrolase n=1 Tax=Amphibalanus amphitrite TaxID=1232801 RepID=A0A6A4VC79_AMPAM|nr:Venom carboxylesterase-6 [Amphibalanus amphitrite]
MKAVGLLRTVLTAAILLAGTASAEQEPVVATKAGFVRGTTLTSLIGNEFFSFKGIPYAQPPVGALRFRLPEPHEGWPGVRNASEHGNRCPQTDVLTHQPTGDEDCLFLNVYTPRLPSEREDVRLPVMVWVHGGGFMVGDGNAAPMTGPEYLLDQQVVLVTLNYRLGTFGFFTTGDGAASGNYGLHDQVLALRWVQDNIEAFGGDPDRVTIFGESAGGASIGLLVLSPLAQGLFARAISQSGAASCNFAANGAPQGRLARQHAELLGCRSDTSEAIVDCLRQKSTEEIMETVAQLDGTKVLMLLAIPYKPRVDTEADIPFLPEDPYLALQSGRFNRVPWMNGMTENEGAGNTAMVLARMPDTFATQDWNVWGRALMDLRDVTDDPATIAEKIYRFYLGEELVTKENINRVVDIVSDRTFTSCISSEIELASSHTPVYKYILNHRGPGRQSLLDMLGIVLDMAPDQLPDLGVSHADDLAYLFRGSGSAPVELGSERHRMVRFMVSVWTSFARDGYPSSDVVPMPSWPPYSAEQQQHMWLSSEPSVGQAAFNERVSFWNTLDIKENWRGPMEQQQRDEL